MRRLRYGYLADLICCLLLSIVIGGILCSFTKYFFLKEIPGGNVIELDYQFIKQPGQMIISRYDEDRVLVNSDNLAIDLKKSRQSYVLDVPFIHSHRLTLSFTPSDNLVAIYRLNVNGEDIDLREINHIFRIPSGMGAAYSYEYNALIVHNQSANNELEFAPGFKQIIRLSRQELSDLKHTEILVNIIYFIFCCLVAFFILYFFMHVCIANHVMYLYYGLVFLVTLLSFDMSFVKATENYILNLNNKDVAGNLVKIQQSYLPLLYLGIILPLIVSCQVRRIWMSVIVLLIPCALILILLLDNFVICNIDSRFMFIRMERSEFFQHYQYVLPFIIKYLKTQGGWFMLLGIILFGVSCVISLRRLAMRDQVTLIVAFVVGIVLVGFGLYPIKSEYNDHKFSNVFQINNFTTNKLGNFQMAYSKNYAPRENLDFEFKTRKGKNLRQNVIVLMVSSLDCSVTFVCGLEDNYMPNLEKIASENTVYDNYYSGNFSMYGSYLTLTSGIPYFPSRVEAVISEYAKQLYDRPNMLANFKKNGYSTSFFFGGDLLSEMNQVVSNDHYDHVYTDKSPEFAGVSKRYAFNSVPDRDLYGVVADKVRQEKQPFFYLVRTASSHSPYSTPWGDYNFEQSFRYTDTQLGIFIQALESSGYFQNGILVITGDHKAMDNPRNPERHQGVMMQNKVPLIIVGDKSRFKNTQVYFSHASLGVLLQSLELPTYEINKFLADPLKSKEPETIVHYEFERKNFVIVKIGDEEAELKLLGDDTVFQQHIFSPDVEQDVLGYIAWIRL